MFIRRDNITHAWFFSNPHPLLRFLGIYIRGDALILIPFFVILLLISLISLRLGILILGIYISVRALGEMIYWIHQQFGPKTYRPPDYGLSNLSNEGLYVVYQLTSMINLIIGIAVILSVFLEIK